MSLPDPVVIGVAQFARLQEGRYILTASTADEPVLLSVDSTIKPDGTSSFVTKLQEHKNDVNGVDKLAQAHVVFRWDSGTTQASLENLFGQLKTMLDATAITRLMRGER